MIGACDGFLVLWKCKVQSQEPEMRIAVRLVSEVSLPVMWPRLTVLWAIRNATDTAGMLAQDGLLSRFEVNPAYSLSGGVLLYILFLQKLTSGLSDPSRRRRPLCRRCQNKHQGRALGVGISGPARLWHHLHLLLSRIDRHSCPSMMPIGVGTLAQT